MKYVARSPFGLALQGLRDNARRMEALGFDVTAHRIAAHALAGAIAAVGGVLLVWYDGLITPASIGTNTLINILIIAVIGGMRHPIGPFLGALVFVLLQNFAIDLVNRERFNLVIGTGFLLIVLFSPDGLLGLWARLRARLGNAAGGPPPVRRGDGLRAVTATTTTGGAMKSNRRSFVRTAIAAAVLSAWALRPRRRKRSRSACSPRSRARSRPAAPTACAARSWRCARGTSWPAARRSRW